MTVQFVASYAYRPMDRGAVVELHGPAVGGWPTVGIGEAVFESSDALASLSAVLGDAALRLAPFADDSDDIAQSVAACIAPMAREMAAFPTARFALETALCDWLARRRGVSLATLLGGGKGEEVERNALVPLSTPNLQAHAMDLARAGYRGFKAKVGRSRLAADLRATEALRACLGPDAELRLDANGAFDVAGARALLAQAAAIDAAYVEEPTGGEGLLALGACGAPWAADESLVDARLADRLLRAAGCGAFVLKPARLGIFRTLALAREARDAGVQVVITHAMDGPVGLAAACEVALALAPDVGRCGLDPHPGLAHWPQVALPQLAHPARVVPGGTHGLGLPWPH
jgi:L-alanine-DL-glutamate epimerase-like enolase superfamily enzyme